MILAIVQARVSSSRLPGKVLADLHGMPMLLRQLERLARSKKIDYLLVATSANDTDDEIARLCAEHNYPCYRGDLDDVLSRFYNASKQFPADYIVRITGDCPVLDPDVVDKVISACVEGDHDYASNTLRPTYPDGLDVEVFKKSCLDEAMKFADLPSQREHVTTFIHQQQDRFDCINVEAEEDFSLMRLTVDEPEDLELIRQVYKSLYDSNPCFNLQDILSLLSEAPDLLEVNKDFQRNEGLEKSLKQDANFLKG